MFSMFELMDFIPYDYICRAIYIIGNKLRIGLRSHADYLNYFIHKPYVPCVSMPQLRGMISLHLST